MNGFIAAPVLPPGTKLVEGICLPASERHFAEMIEQDSKIGVVELADGRRVGTYQLHKLRKAMRHIPADRRRVAVDIGAQVGLWTQHLVELFARVECFEPVPLHRDCFAFNVRAGNAAMHACALGAAPLPASGTIDMTVHGSVTGNAHVVVGPPRAGEKRGETITVPIRTLDSFALAAVDFVKIDVEGWELAVVHGARETLLRCKPWIVVEQKGNDFKHYAQPRDGAVAFLEGLGFKVLWDYSGDHLLQWAGKG